MHKKYNNIKYIIIFFELNLLFLKPFFIKIFYFEIN